MSKNIVYKVFLTGIENCLTIKCEATDELQNKSIYINEFTSTNITQFGVGNFTNFSKLCKEVFGDNESTAHSVLYSENANDTNNKNILISITYSSIFEFKFELILPFIKTEYADVTNIANTTISNSMIAPVIDDINNLKLSMSSIINDIIEIKQKENIFNISNISNIIKELTELKNVILLMCNDIKKLEKFVYCELNEIKIVENDNNEKLSTNCSNLNINLTDCLCCTVNKFTPYNGETNYTINMDPKFKLTENFKIVKCKELSINIGTSIDNLKLNTLPITVEYLTVQSNSEQTNFMFLATANLPNLKIFHIKNICRSTNFDLAIQNLNPNIVHTTNSDVFLKEHNLNQHGYHFKEEIKPDQYKVMNTFVYVKTLN